METNSRSKTIRGQIRRIVFGVALLFATPVFADTNTDCANNQNCYNSGAYIYESGQDLIDLHNNWRSTSYNLNAGDDQWSSQVTLSNTWNRWGKSWDKARMSTNGCVNFVGRSDGANSSNCNDYTPQSLPYRNYTLYPFWTDLIRGNNSTMLFRNFDDYAVFGWYYMKEYNRSSSNSFEVILWNNDTYDFRYRELDIDRHDVVIGEQGASNETKTYLFYNDNQNGNNTFDAYLANYGGPDIENGGSLYSEGLTFDQQCAQDPLYSDQCSGYAQAYQDQQCALDPLFNENCTGYAQAYEDQQCLLDPLYSENCLGYAMALFDLECLRDPLFDRQCEGYYEELAYQETFDDMEDMSGTGYTEEELDMFGFDEDFEAQALGFGSEEELYGYDEVPMDGVITFVGDDYSGQDIVFIDDVFNTEMDDRYGDGWEEFTDEEWYEIDVEEFGQEQVDDWYGEEVEFREDGMIDWEQTEIYLPEDDLVAFLEPTDITELENGGVVIFTEEEWIPRDEVIDELPEIEEFFTEDILEDLEREELEDFIEFVEEAFDEEIDIDVLEEIIEDEAFEELINEEELEELLAEEPEELIQEEEVIEEVIEEEVITIEEEVKEAVPAEGSNKDTRPSRSAMVIAKLKKELGAAASVVSEQVQSGSDSGGGSGSGVTSNGGSQGSTGMLVDSSQSGDSFQLDQQEQQTGQVDIQVSSISDVGPQTNVFEVAEQQQEQQTQQQEFTFESNDSFGGGDVEFSNRFDDAVSTGQSIGQFLSNEQPNFAKFDVKPPTVKEQRQTKAAESLADRMGDEAAQAQIAAQLESNQESGGFGDQTVAVAVIGYNPGIQQYLSMDQLNDQPDWYKVKKLYTDAKIDDNKYQFYMMAGQTEKKLKEMVLSQYNQEQ